MVVETFDPATVKAPIWGPQSCDTPKSFEAFIIYRDLGINRKVRLVAEKLDISPRGVDKWYALYGWKERADAYDKYLDQVRLIEAEDAFKMRVKEEAKRTVELIFNAKRIVEHDVGVLMRRANRQLEEAGEDGDDATVLDRATAVKLMDRVVILERLTTGSSTESIDVKDKGPRTIKHVLIGGDDKPSKPSNDEEEEGVDGD
jgi:hypothetical protein